MKLLIITAVKAFERRIHEVLNKNQVYAYSYNGVTGFRKTATERNYTNWFGTEINTVDSLLFFIFVSEPVTVNIYNDVEEINKTCDVHSRIHIAVTSIEKYNESIKD